MTKNNNEDTVKLNAKKTGRQISSAHDVSLRSDTETQYCPPMWIPLDRIDITDTDRLRESDNMEIVEEYAEVFRQNMKDGELVKGENQNKFPFPPCSLYKKAGGRFGLPAGRHRALAAQKVGLRKIWCVIYTDESEAVWDGLGDNRKHGLRNSGNDLKKMISIALQQYPDRSHRAIAEHIGCSSTYVDRIAKELQEQTGLQPPPTRTGRDNKKHPTQQPKRKKTADNADSGSETDALDVPKAQDLTIELQAAESVTSSSPAPRQTTHTARQQLTSASDPEICCWRLALLAFAK